MKKEDPIAPQIYVFDDAEELAVNLAQDFWKQILQANEQFSIALSGGSTPKIFFKHLADRHAEINWEKVYFFWGDERAVPPEHAESNYRMTRETLLDHIEMPVGNIHRILGEAAATTEAERYAREISQFLVPDAHGIPVFDWILLGMGTDGHTASLFPGAATLTADQWCVAAVHPETGQHRVSLTLPVINHARRVSFLVTGGEKADLVKNILQTKARVDLPAARVKPVSGRLEWYLDRAAAAQL